MTIIRVVDFETTGTEPPAEVCEVGICDLGLEGKSISEPFSWLCGVKEMPPEVRAIHHITLAECARFPKFDPSPIYAIPVCDVCGGTGQIDFDATDQGGTSACDACHGVTAKDISVSAIAAHNSSFETKFFTPSRPVICTYKSALRVWPDAPSHSNGALRYWLEDQQLIHPEHALTQPAHRAGPDAYVTAHILLALFNAGATGKDMVRWTKEPRLLPTCPIGKFKGRPWAEVEDGFLGWMMRQETMEEDLKWNAGREIARRSGGTK